jgi:hypothetical protein
MGGFGIVGQVIHVPADVNNMVTLLPRELDDFSFNVHIKRNLIHKSTYLKGIVKKDTIKRWLAYLINIPLYRHYNITVNGSFFHRQQTIEEENIRWTEDTEHSSDVELLIAQQQTLLWNEEKYLEIAPAQKNTPLSIIYDEHAEEFSFPGIYLGRARQFKEGHKVTPFMMATSDIRQSDRRGVIPQHVLYMAMKIMRLRVSEGLYSTFKCIGETENITRNDRR